MDTLMFLDRLRKAGIQLSRTGGDIRVMASSGVVTPELREEIRSNKKELLELLQRAGDDSDRILKAPVSPDYPVSFIQRGIWLLSQEDDACQAYNIPIVLPLTGDPDVQALGLAFEDLMERHVILRTSFFAGPDGEIRQRIGETPHPFTIRLFRPSTADQVKEIMLEESMRSFDLGRAPLLRASLLQEEREDPRLLVVIHHIICDGVSLDILRNEIIAAYVKRKTGLLAPPQVMDLAYHDFAVWEHNNRSAGGWQEEAEFWKKNLEGELPLLQLNGNGKRPSIKTFNGRHAAYYLPGDIESLIRQYCRINGFSLFNGLLSVLNALFFRYTGSRDLVIGIVVSGRENPQVQPLIGPFINTIPIRTHLSPDWNFDGLSAHQKNVLETALSHQSIPFGYLVELLNKKKDVSRSALFDILVVFNDGGDSMDLRTTSQFDITFSFSQNHRGIGVNIEFNSDIYDDVFIAGLWRHYCGLMRSAIRDTGEPIKTISFLSATELDQLLRIFSQPEADYAVTGTVLDLIETSVRKMPDHIAIIGDHGHFTYSEMWKEVVRLAHYLDAEPTLKNTAVIGVMLERTEWLPIALMAVWYSGRTYVPLDKTYQEERIGYMVKDSGCGLILTDQWLTEYRGSGYTIREPQQPSAASPRQLAYIIYTSGSTGTPNGVMISHRNAASFIHWALGEFEEGNFRLVYSITSHCFDLSIFELFYTLAAGKAVRMLPSAIYVKEYLHKDDRVLINTVPSAVREFLRDADFPWQNISCLNMAGEAVPVLLKEELASRVAETRNLYGPTETTTYSTCCLFSTSDREVSIGTPVGNTRVYILDKFRQPVPVGVKGEIYIAGEGVSGGYRNNIILTLERFIDDPWVSGATLFKTGDIGSWDAKGNIYYFGREDHQVKIRGFRIECGEIENALESTGRVTRALVASMPTDQGDQLVAYITTDHKQDPADLSADLKKKLPPFMIPARFVLLDEFPLTVTGKIDRKALAEIALRSPSGEKVLVLPKDAAQQKIHEVWKEVLGRSEISVADNFFDIGGNSLHVFRLQSLLSKRAGLKENIRFFFENATIGQQAEALKKGDRVFEEPIPQTEPSAWYPLNGFQKRIWTLHNAGAGEAYHIQCTMEIKGVLDVGALNQAILFLVRRHELLSSVFRVNDTGELIRIVLPVGEEMISPEIIDLPDHSSLAEIAAGQHSRPFLLHANPPFRVTLVRTGHEEACLLLCLHHIICDGWSLQIIYRDLLQAYASFRNGETPDLPPLPVRFSDYVDWSSRLNNEKARQFWKQYPGSDAQVLKLPSDHIRPAKRLYNGKNLRKKVDPETYDKLSQLCRSNNITLFSGLFSCFALLMWRYAGQDDVMIGTVAAGRGHSMLSDLVGPLVNTLPVRVKIDRNESLIPFFKNVHRQLLLVYENQNYPYDEIIEEYNHSGKVKRNSLFEIMLAFQSEDSGWLDRQINEYGKDAQLKLTSLDEFATVTSQMDLTLIFEETSSGLQLNVEYDADLFAESYIGRMICNFGQLLQSVTENPSATPGSCNPIAEDEIRSLLGAAPGPGSGGWPVSLAGHFESRALIAGSSIALTSRTGVLSYAELNLLAGRFGSFLRSKIPGNIPGRIALQMRRSERTIIAWLGILKYGGVCIPIDPNCPEERKGYILDESQPALVVNEMLMEEFMTTKEVYADSAETEAISTSDTACILYLTARAGKIPGVALSHSNILTLVMDNNAVRITDEDVLLQCNRLALPGSVFEIFGALLNGANLILPTEEEATAVESLKKQIYLYRVSILFVTPALFNVVANTDPTTFHPLRKLVIGEGALPEKNVSRALDHIGSGKIIKIFGFTETTMLGAWHVIDKSSRIAPGVALGFPTGGSYIYILDESLSLLPKGAAGEICIGGNGVVAGYLRDEGHTAGKFPADPFNAGRRLYRTGETGRWMENGMLTGILKDTTGERVQYRPTTPQGKLPEEKPDDPVESKIREIWQKILNVGPFRKKEDFSQLGGHSLNAGVLLAELKRTFGVELSIADLLYSSLEEQAILIRKSVKQVESELVQHPAMDRYPVSEQQLSLIISDLFQNKGRQYCIQITTRLKGEMDVGALGKAVGDLLEKHDILRTVYGFDESGEVVQWVKNEIGLHNVWEFIDFSDAADKDEAIDMHTRIKSGQPFNLETGPLFKVSLLRYSSNEYLFIFFLHHIVSDGWGLQLLQNDLLSLYALSATGEAAETPVRSSYTYRDYVLFQKRLLTGDTGRQLKAFWEDQFAIRPVEVELPLVEWISGSPDDAVRFVLDPLLLSELRQLALSTKSSLFVLSLTAVNILLYSYTKQTDITVSCPFAGRINADSNHVVGQFVNLLPVRNVFTEALTIGQLLATTNNSFKSILQHQIYPITLLSQFLKDKHNVDVNDLCKISINYMPFDIASKRIQETILRNTGLVITEVQSKGQENKYDLNFVFTEEEDQLVIYLELNPQKFSRSFVSQLSHRLLDLLSLLVYEPDLSVASQFRPIRNSVSAI
jgi:amino acid adenylation domain-containing protein